VLAPSGNTQQAQQVMGCLLVPPGIPNTHNRSRQAATATTGHPDRPRVAAEEPCEAQAVAVDAD